MDRNKIAHTNGFGVRVAHSAHMRFYQNHSWDVHGARMLCRAVERSHASCNEPDRWSNPTDNDPCHCGGTRPHGHSFCESCTADALALCND